MYGFFRRRNILHISLLRTATGHDAEQGQGTQIPAAFVLAADLLV